MLRLQALSEKIDDFFHAFHLVYAERTTAVAVAALHACVGVDVKPYVMFFSHLIAVSCQVVVFIRQAYIYACRARLAVVAVYAFAGGVCRFEASF